MVVVLVTVSALAWVSVSHGIALLGSSRSRLHVRVRRIHCGNRLVFGLRHWLGLCRVARNTGTDVSVRSSVITRVGGSTRRVRLGRIANETAEKRSLLDGRHGAFKAELP